jgi:histidinol-phosphate aminotransferase
MARPLPLVEPHLASLIAYIPGKPIEETEREYGVSNIAKLASNENCLGPSPLALAAMKDAVEKAHLYPDAGGFYLKERLAKHHEADGVGAEHLVLGNGTNEILTLLVRAFVGPTEKVCIGWPSFVVYRLAAWGLNRGEVVVDLDDELAYDLPKMADAIRADDAVKVVFVANPNNPTGRYLTDADLNAFADALPSDVILVVDEAYTEYVDKADYADGLAIWRRRPRTVVTRTFSKIYGLAALRVGYGVCDPEIADILNRLRDPFNVNQVGQSAALAGLDDTEHLARAKAHNLEALPVLTRGLNEMDVEVTPSVANFVLMHLDEGLPEMAEINERLLKRGVIVRPMKGYGLPRAARVTAGTVEENSRFLAALEEILQEVR